MLAAGAVGIASVPAAAILGCGDAGGDKPQGTLRTGTSLPIGSGLDPQVQSGSGLAITAKVYGYLLHIDPRDESLILDHARALEQPDDTTYIIHLKKGVRFHDLPPANGRDVTARDALESIERYRANPLAINRTWHTTVLDRLDAVDDRTLLVSTKRPYIYTPHVLGDVVAGAILPAEAIDGNIDITRGGAGSGPLQFADVTLPSRVLLGRFAGYHGERARVDGMQWTVFDEGADPVSALRGKVIDVLACRDKHEADNAALAAEGVAVSRQPNLSWLSLGMNCRQAPFSDVRVRQAVDYAVDRVSLIDQIAFGEGDVPGPVNQHLADGYWSLTQQEVAAAQGSPRSREDRTAEARQRLEASGQLGAPFSLQVADEPQLIDLANAVATDLRRAGLYPLVQPLPLLPWFVNFRSGNFGMTLISQLPYESPDMPMRTFHSLGIDGTGSAFGFSDPAIDRLIERSWETRDRDARRDLVRDAQRLMIDARPVVQLFSGMSYSAAWGYVHGHQPDLPGSLGLYYHHEALDLPVPGRHA